MSVVVAPAGTTNELVASVLPVQVVQMNLGADGLEHRAASADRDYR